MGVSNIVTKEIESLESKLREIDQIFGKFKEDKAEEIATLTSNHENKLAGLSNQLKSIVI